MSVCTGVQTSGQVCGVAGQSIVGGVEGLVRGGKKSRVNAHLGAVAAAATATAASAAALTAAAFDAAESTAVKISQVGGVVVMAGRVSLVLKVQLGGEWR